MTEPTSRVRELNLHRQYFELVAAGTKTIEVRVKYPPRRPHRRRPRRTEREGAGASTPASRSALLSSDGLCQ
ncbi:ASCH domain-containing protein [Streptomyces sp. NPDC048312]|uniref:ASCH domain-containing protein n=1 Tax=Streptomyces sp. NPDC048312 TaxID=3155485 RepID=UPI003402B079